MCSIVDLVGSANKKNEKSHVGHVIRPDFDGTSYEAPFKYFPLL